MDADLDWRAIPTVNRAGGLLCIWKNVVFSIEECFTGEGFIGLKGKWGGKDCVICNVYSSCLLRDKRRQWGEMIVMRHRFDELPWCVARDFNSVRNDEERKGNQEIGSNGGGEIEEFNSFINEMEIDD